ncbi:AbrB family transcriptional regulator [Nocardioides sp. MAHUQ-72]|uniref:AbrB family transcriptional regulator n=1 Tax=unclassified Nocardioides TaxID=2615069 RepID=UPI0036171C56
MPTRSRARGWALVLAVTTATSLGLELLGLPSPVLFGALLGGMAHALTSPTVLGVPVLAFRVGQGLVGVTIGALVSVDGLARMGADVVPILAVTLGTLGLSLAAGRALALRRDVSTVTGVFALIAGGASGVVAVAHELGADDRVVTVVQYLRVLMVLLAMPLVTALVFSPAHGVAELDGGGAPWPTDAAYTLVALTVGLLLARLVAVPTATLLGPMAVAVALGAGGWAGFDAASVPTLLQDLAYLLIGVQVGLRFTRASLAAITRMLPVVVALITAVIALCAGLGALLTLTTGVDGLTAYLATTPGGLFAVLATAADSGADVTYVTAAQVFRLLVILLLTPPLASWLRRAPRD